MILIEFLEIHILLIIKQGRIHDFHLGGVQKVMCQHAHYERGTELAFGRGPGPT